MEKGYCPKCGKEVYMKREDIDICLCIILAIFTAGIGLLIYMVIYLDKKENRCVHCNSICIPISNNHSQPFRVKQEVPREVVYSQETRGTSNASQGISKEYEDNNKVRYCYSCGSLLYDPEKAQFCNFCGSTLD